MNLFIASYGSRSFRQGPCDCWI